MKKYDILIIGSGIAGLTYSVKVAVKRPELNICIVTKSNPEESNTKYAQGGIAAVWDLEKDSFDKHVEDTLKAGDGLCNEKVVRMVVTEGPDRVREIIQWGTQFDKDEDGDYHLGREGGHSEDRVLHHKDLTGYEIEKTLLRQINELENVDLLSDHFALDLITQHHAGRIITRHSEKISCYGAYVLDSINKNIKTLLAKVTILASGGAGQVYKSTTNPIVATGDGMAMVYRAKGRLANMEFVQFHPTSLYNPDESPSFLISEAVRGAGAILRTSDGQTFMEDYDPRKSLAPRDIVARVIDNEMKKRGEECVYLDCTRISKEEILGHFPNIYEKCKSIGLDMMKDFIPVVPAAHYMCGGVKIDQKGQTTIRNLYACGEVTSSGLHGANRLASNSLLEALVYSHRIFVESIREIDQIEFAQGIPEWNNEGTSDAEEMVLITHSLKELKDIMSSYVSIVRSDLRLKRALSRLALLYRETEDLYNSTILFPELCELRNLITIAYLISRSATFRKESRGLHYTIDYPEKIAFIEETVL